MATVKERVDALGRISIKKILKDANIKPGDLLEIIPEENKIVLKIVRKEKPPGDLEKIAGKWKNRPDLVTDILRMRHEEDREVPELE